MIQLASGECCETEDATLIGGLEEIVIIDVLINFVESLSSHKFAV